MTRCVRRFDQQDPDHKAAANEAATLAVVALGGTEGLIRQMHDVFGIEMDHHEAFDALCEAADRIEPVSRCGRHREMPP